MCMLGNLSHGGELHAVPKTKCSSRGSQAFRCSFCRQIHLKDSWKKILTTPNFSPNLRQNLELGGLGSRFQKESGNGRGEWKECHIDLLRIGDGLKKLKKLVTHKLTNLDRSGQRVQRKNPCLRKWP